MDIQKYTLLLMVFTACSSMAMNKTLDSILNESDSSTTTSSSSQACKVVLKPLNLLSESSSSSSSEPVVEARRVLEPQVAKKIAQDLYDKVQILSAISSHEARPANVSKYIIEQIEILDIASADQDDIFDAFMPLHTLEHTITIASKMICYALSHGGDRIAYAEQDGKNITLHVDHRNNTGVWEPWSICRKRLEDLTQIYWNKYGDLYTMHSTRQDTNARMLAWKEARKKAYEIDAEYVPKDWRAFYTSNSIITNPEQKTALTVIQKKDDLNLTIRTTVSCVPMMLTYLEQNYQRRLQEDGRK